MTFGYEEHVVLEHMSFKVMAGEQATLSGRTGAGKSTILKLLLGLYEPLEGDVLIHGVPAVQIGEEERRRLFGYVEQSFHMVPGTVRDQITLFDEKITESQIRKAAELTGLQDAIEGLEPWIRYHMHAGTVLPGAVAVVVYRKGNSCRTIIAFAG